MDTSNLVVIVFLLGFVVGFLLRGRMERLG